MDSTVEVKNCIDKIIDSLQSMLGRYGGCDGFDLSKIEEEGRYLKTLFQCASKCSSNRQSSSISRIESAFYVQADSLYSSLTIDKTYWDSERSERLRAESERLRAERLRDERFRAESERSERLRAESERLRDERFRAESERSEWLRAESERLRDESERLRAELLRAESERLRVSSERLRDESERLREWLRAESERFIAESERLRDESERFIAESERLRDESERLREWLRAESEAESERLRDESERLRAESEWSESERLRAEAESERLRDESERLRAESEWLRDESERLKAESERLRADSKRLRAESERLRAESERFRADTCCRTSKLVKQPIWDLYCSIFESRSFDDDNGLNRLKVDLKLLKAFFLCAFRQEHLEYPKFKYSCPEDRDYSQFERDFAPLYDHGKQFFCLLISEEEGLSYYQELAEAVSMFRERIQGFNQLICEWYSRISLNKWTHDMKSLLALLECVEDIIICGVQGSDTTTFKTLIEPLKGMLPFFRNSIFLVIFTGLKFCFEDLLDDSRVVAIDAARLCCICWFYSYRDDDDQLLDDIKLNISDLVRSLEAVNRTFHDRYHNFLGSSLYQKLSFTQLIEPDLHAVGIFVDSLVFELWRLLSSSTGIAVSIGHEMEMLAEGLKLLTAILKKQQEKLHGLHGETKNLIKDVICGAGNLIPSLSSLDHPLTEEADKARINLELVHLLENIELIKAEFGTKSPMSTFNFPAANELEFIDLILENLKDLPSHKVDSIPSGNDRILEVREDLLSLRSFLETIQGHCDHNGKLQTLWNQVIEVAYNAEFAIDSLIAEDISPNSLMLFDYIAKEIMHVKNEAIKIGDLKFVLPAQKVAKTSSHVPSQGTISLIKDKSHETAETSRSVPAQGTISQINDVVVGFDDEAKAIIDQLKRGSMELDVVFITGMPGLGKTTLAKMVCHDSSVIYHFHIRAWCSVSQVWCKKDVLLEILQSIAPEHSNQDSKKNEDDLAEQLHKLLKGNRYLIVLDDVWGIETWNDLKIYFPNDTNGSRILLTGRQHFTVKPYHLRRLSDDECWELLQKKLVHKVDFSPSLCDIGRRIAKNCNGLPLSVVIIAGILADLEQVGWEEVAMSTNIVCGTEECMNILDLSYRHLPNYLKPCLLYFGAFLEDQEIPIEKLMWLWIAEGFVQKNEQTSLEHTANDYIMALISRNLVMVAKQGSLGGVKTCRIHDLLHEFCQVKSKEQNFLNLIRRDEELFDFDRPHKLRRLRMYSQPTHFENWRIFCPRIRSLLFFSCGASGDHIKSYDLSFVFSHKLLRVLDLGQINLGLIFPCAITILVHLRYLSIVVGGMKVVPESIANLSNLETFLVKTNFKGFSLPNSIWNMQKLRHLHVHGWLVDFNLSTDNLENSSNLDNLDTFSTPKLYLGQSMERIMNKFPNVRKLKCSVADFEESNGNSSSNIVVINFPSKLESLKLILGNVDVLHAEFNFPSSLRKLTLTNFSWSMISTVRKLPNLEVLKLLNGAVDEVDKWDMTEEEFPNLKILKLEYSDIVSWTSSGDHHFPCLEKLFLEGCRKLEELPSCLEEIFTLELIKVHRCLEQVGSLVKEIEEEHEKWGNEGLKILITEVVEEDLIDYDDYFYSSD